MATQFASSVPASAAALPFLFARPDAAERGSNLRAALAAAIAAERANESLRNTRCRVAYLMCETAFQLRRRGQSAEELPLTRSALAEALGVSLARVKRTLALLSLSKAVQVELAAIRILDLRRLCGVARYDCSRFGLPEEDGGSSAPRAEEERADHRITAGGDPACFV